VVLILQNVLNTQGNNYSWATAEILHAVSQDLWTVEAVPGKAEGVKVRRSS